MLGAFQIIKDRFSFTRLTFEYTSKLQSSYLFSIKSLTILLAVIALGSIPTGLSAQHRCATMEYLAENKKLSKEQLGSFENWLSRRLRIKALKSTLLDDDTLLVIPVVVHVIHNGDEVGTDENISAEQIYSQFDVLNKDYGRMNADRFHTPNIFKDVAADTRIAFQPAVINPEVQVMQEPGIHRVVAERTEWGSSQLDDEIKPITSWDPNQYLNIWVADLQGSTLGYSTWPKEPGINGVPFESAPPEEEGIVVSYQVFGSNFTPRGSFDQLSDPRYDKGRTTTHEIGHYFGLLHPWGFTGGCGDDDFCADTPTTRRNRDDIDFPCSFPDEQNTCDDGANDLPDMFQNYMDYTADVCMNLFTHDQKSRMRAVITGAPRRASLLTSDVIPPHHPPFLLEANFISETVVEVRWADNVANATTITIERSDAPSSGFAQIAEIEANQLNYFDTLQNEQAAYYRLQAQNRAGSSAYSTVKLVGDQQLPNAPSNLAGNVITPDSVELNWQVEGNEIGHLVLEWSFEEESGFQIGKYLSPSVTSCNLRGLKDGQTYFFRIKAENTIGSSGYSNIVQLQTLPYPPIAPQDVFVDFLTDSRKFQLTWEQEGDVAAYRIYRAQNSTASFQEVALSNDPLPTFVDADLEVPAGARFFYMVRAENEGGLSGFSNIAEFNAITALPIDYPLGNETMIYPNPAVEQVFFQADDIAQGKVNLRLYDLSGRTLWQKSQEHKGGRFNAEISAVNLAEGMYFLSVEHALVHENIVHKLLIQK